MPSPGVPARAALLLALFLIAGRADAEPGPSLVRDQSPAVCRDALTIAVATYGSSASVLYEPPVVPPAAGATVAVGPPDDSELFETPLDVHGDSFRMMAENDGLRYYWQERPVNGLRFALKQEDIGWRGPMFSAFVVPADVPEAQFRTEVVLDGSRQANTRIQRIQGDSWAAPRVLVMPDGTPWLLTVGNVFEVLADWQVYVLQPRGASNVCSIAFPRQADVPQAIRAFARLLDSTLGSNLDEGTMQTTAHLRVAASHTWANAVFRPWAVGGAYNSRAHVDAGLKAWSRGGPSFMAIYDQIVRQYPISEAALSAWYQRAFGLSPAKAARVASFALDVAYRDNFTFSGNDGGTPQNPW